MVFSLAQPHEFGVNLLLLLQHHVVLVLRILHLVFLPSLVVRPPVFLVPLVS